MKDEKGRLEVFGQEKVAPCMPPGIHGGQVVLVVEYLPDGTGLSANFTGMVEYDEDTRQDLLAVLKDLVGRIGAMKVRSH